MVFSHTLSVRVFPPCCMQVNKSFQDLCQASPMPKCVQQALRHTTTAARLTSPPSSEKRRHSAPPLPPVPIAPATTYHQPEPARGENEDLVWWWSGRLVRPGCMEGIGPPWMVICLNSSMYCSLDSGLGALSQ